MTLNMFAIRDEKADAYNAPFFTPTIGMALRAFQDLTNDVNTTVAKHPADYRLYHLGTFDPDSGKVETFEPRYLATASDFNNADVPVGLHQVKP